jgi:hypothetical protein
MYHHNVVYCRASARLHDPSSVLSVRWCGIASRLRRLAEQEQGEEEEEAEGTSGVIDFEQAAFILGVM